MQQNADIIVIGGGIAGVSAAAELSAHAKVVVLEMEQQPGYHATGRSAAYFALDYGNAVVRGITASCEHFYRSPPTGFTEVELLRRRACLFIGREDQQGSLLAMHDELQQFQVVSMETIVQRVPILSAGYVAGGLIDERGGDLDVDAILQGYLRLLRSRGGVLATDRAVTGIERRDGCWQLHTAKETFKAPIIVNAAGAWADTVAEMAGVGGFGIAPLRRSALLIDVPDGIDCQHWPMVIDVDEEFYFKPDAGQLLLSPADETPSEPCDAQAGELDIAIAVDRFEKATGVTVKRVNHSWAGLRSFTNDETFVLGFDPRADDFFWLAGQGGYGVQSAPALAQMTMALVTGSQLQPEFAKVMDYKEDVAPERLLVSG